MKRKRTVMAIPLIAVTLVLFAGLASFPLEAQQGIGEIMGMITNDEGKPVQGATIKLTGTTKGAISKADGRFLITFVPIGEYEMTVTLVGYTPFATRLRVSEGQITTVNPSLTTKSERLKGIAIREKTIRSETNGSRRSISFDQPTTSARTNIQGSVAPSSGSATGGVNGYSIRSGRGGGTPIHVDGILVNDPFQGGFGSTGSGYYPTVSSVGDTSAATENRKNSSRESASEADAKHAPEPIVENEFIPTMHEPTSTFGIDVDNASYTLMRQLVTGGQLPPRSSVRIEEMLNYFTYDYPEPTGTDPFSIITEVSSCPWESTHRLVHIGLQGRHIDMSALPPSNFVFLIDVSGSMAPANRLPLLIDGFKLLVQQLREQDHVAIVVYAGSAGLVLPSTSGSEKETIIDALGKLRAGGSTAGGLGINLAYAIAANNFKPDGNNRVILATDGDFNVGITSDDALVKLIESKRKDGIFLTVLGFGMGNYRDGKMEKLADNGNGTYAYIDNIREAERVLVSELSGTLYTIAKDVKLQVEFNPITVAGYRLIGYEDRVLANEDFANDLKDAGDLGAGHSVTALYEIIPARRAKEEAPQLSDATMRYQLRKINAEAYMSNELMDIRLRYKLPADSVSRLIEHPITDMIRDIGTASESFRFAAAVAELGMLLRDSKYKGTATYESMLTLAASGRGADSDGYRAELIRLAERCRELSGK